MILVYLVTILVILILIIIIYKIFFYKTTMVKSDITNEYFSVRDLADKQKASNMLSLIHLKMTKLTDYLEKNKKRFPNYEKYIDDLSRKMKALKIKETSDIYYTSYTVDKGEQTVFCLRSKINDQIHDINLLTYVVLHEMSHIACPEYGHTELFKRIFAFITQKAIEIGIYEKINFNKKQVEYCGMMITDSII